MCIEYNEKFDLMRRRDDMQFRDLGVLVAVIAIVAMLVIPLPPWLLSFLIIINITIALLVLLTSMNMQEALQFSISHSIATSYSI